MSGFIGSHQMTITLKVKEVIRDAHLFVSRWRLAVNGILLFSADEFKIYQLDDAGELDEETWLRIDDPLAADSIRRILPPLVGDNWDYFGRALIEAWTRIEPDEIVLHEIVQLWLRDLGRAQEYVKIRPHPWGWDQFG
jgi:hypothetical protein